MSIRRIPAVVLAITLLALLYGGAAAWASAVPPCSLTSPSYTDFSTNQGCLTTAGTTTFPAPTGSAATITSWSGDGSSVTFHAANSFVAGEVVALSGFANSTFFNGMQVVVLATNLSGSQFEIASSQTGSSDTGTATPVQALQLTTNKTGQDGSAFFTAQQTVSDGFSTTFTFQLSQSNTDVPADGIAFVIQNSAANALGGGGGGIGYVGLSNNVAVEFDTYNNGATDGNSSNHVAILSCGTGPNTGDESSPCFVGGNYNLPVTLSDGNVHTATITYTPSSATNCGPEGTAGTCSTLDVILDGTDLFPGGVYFDLTTIGLDNGVNAWVGFTGATGSDDEIQDILSWTFTAPSQAGVVTTGTPTNFPFQNNAYSYFAQLNTGSPTTVNVTPMLMTPAACDALVQLSYPGAHCFVYTNLSPNPDSAVMFDVTCPGMPSNQCNPFSAELGTNYALSMQNGVNNYSLTDPFPGWLKGNGGVAGNPCAQSSPGSKVFLSNQVDAFALTALDPGSKGGSGGTGSCWVATYAQPDETLSAITITSPTNTSYAQNANVPASYTCATPTSTVPNLPEATSPVGPYLTVASCTQSTGTQASCTTTAAGQSCTGGTVDTSTVGPHTFTVKAMDTGTNTSTQSVNYNVVAATNLQIVNVGTPGTAATGSLISYNIGVADLGPANAVGVMVIDQLPTNTSFVSASGSNVSCTVVSKKLVCTTTPVSCSGGSTVSCNVGTLAPLSISSLNGAAMKITVKVTSQPATMCKVGSAQKPCTIDTATVSADNTDTNPHPSSTVQTIY